MYKAFQNKKYYLAFNKFSKKAKNKPFNYAYTNGFKRWTSEDMTTYAVVIGAYRVMFGFKKHSSCSNGG